VPAVTAVWVWHILTVMLFVWIHVALWMAVWDAVRHPIRTSRSVADASARPNSEFTPLLRPSS